MQVDRAEETGSTMSYVTVDRKQNVLRFTMVGLRTLVRTLELSMVFNLYLSHRCLAACDAFARRGTVLIAPSTLITSACNLRDYKHPMSACSAI